MPFIQLAPLSVLYCQVAPVSRPVTFTLPLEVTPSELLDPVSFASERAGAAGAEVSTMIVAALDLAGPVFPARSIWRTWTTPAA